MTSSIEAMLSYHSACFTFLYNSYLILKNVLSLTDYNLHTSDLSYTQLFTASRQRWLLAFPGFT